MLLYFCTVVCALYLLSGGYKVIRNYVQSKIDEAAAEKVKASAVATASTASATTQTIDTGM
ncbi:DUF1378 family protein [Escherichia coli]|nr:DUF1378 family protein [Escherichia coli]